MPTEISQRKTILHSIMFFKIDLFNERERESTEVGADGEGENLMQTPHRVGSPMLGSISQTGDHVLS